MKIRLSPKSKVQNQGVRVSAFCNTLNRKPIFIPGGDEPFVKNIYPGIRLRYRSVQGDYPFSHVLSIGWRHAGLQAGNRPYGI